MKPQFQNLTFYLAFLFLPYTLQSQSWEPQAIGLLPVNYGVFSISVVNDSVVWAVAFNQTAFPIPFDHITKVLKTTDGGVTWNIYDVEEATGRISFDIVAFDENTALITTQDFGNGVGRGVFKTMDGGETWVEKFHHVAGGVWIRFFNDMDGVIINRQSMATTEDGGETWQLIPSANIPTFQSNEATIIASGSNSCQMLDDHIWFGTDKGRVYRSKDKGKTWEAFNASLGDEALIISVTFKDSLTGIALDASSLNANFSKTYDGGENWEFFNSGPGKALDNVTYVPGTDSVLIATSSFYIPEAVRLSAYSEDFGKTWNTIYSENVDENTSFGGTHFIAPNIGWSSRDMITSSDQAVMYKWNSDIFVGVENINRMDSYSVFPNPFSDHIFVQGENSSAEISNYRIFNNNGNIIKSGVINSNHSEIELGTLPPGFYYLELNANGFKTVKKIIKAN